MRFFLLLISLLIFGVSAAQKVQLAASAILQDKKNATILEAIPFTDSTFLLLKQSDRGYSSVALEEFSINQLAPRNFHQVSLPEIKGMQLYFDRLVMLQGQNYLLASGEDRSDSRIYLFAFRIFSDLNVSPEPQAIGSYLSGSKKTPLRYQVYTNPEATTMLVILPLEPNPDKNEKFGLRLFDSKLNLLKSKELEVPYTSRSYRIEDVLVDGDSIVNLLASVNDLEDAAMSRGKNLGRNYTLIRYLWEDNVLSEKALAFDSKWVYDARLLFTPAHDLQVIGFYSNFLDLTLAGTFSVIVDKQDGSLVFSGLQPFPREFKKQFRSGATIEDNNLNQFELKYVFPLGSQTLLIAEKEYSRTATVYNPATGTYSVVNLYNYDEIILNYLNELGGLVKSVVIPKYQSSSRPYDDYTSFFAVQNRDVVRLFYNDNVRNANLSLDSDKYRALSSPASAVCMMVTLGAESIRKEELFGENSNKLTLNPHLGLPLPAGAILFATSGSKFQLYRLLPKPE